MLKNTSNRDEIGLAASDLILENILQVPVPMLFFFFVIKYFQFFNALE